MQWFILTKPRNPILKEVITLMCLRIVFYNKWYYSVGRKAVLNITGPILFSKVLYRNLNSKIKKVDYRDLGLYYSIFEEKKMNITHRDINASHYTKQVSRPVRYSIFKRLFILLTS